MTAYTTTTGQITALDTRLSQQRITASITATANQLAGELMQGELELPETSFDQLGDAVVTTTMQKSIYCK